MDDPAKLRIAIIGAGIGGLTAAIALKKHPGLDVQVYDRVTELREVGATIALGPNGLRILDEIGVAEAFEESLAFQNKSGLPMIYLHYQTNEVVSYDRHSDNVDRRHRTARFFRPHLQQALLGHVDAARVHLGKAFRAAAFDEAAQAVRLTFTNGSSAMADVVLGADGIHSPVRRFFVPASATRATGWTTFRSVFPIAHVAHVAGLPDEAVHIWGPDRALFLTPLARGLFSVVGSAQEDPDAQTGRHKHAVWNQDGDVDTLREYYRGWSPMVRAVIDATPYTRLYPNAAADVLDTWVLGSGRVALAGDAAHAHGGAFAAGGSLAIDDAWAFAQAITHEFPVAEPPRARGNVGARIERALRLYEAARKPHTDRVQAAVQRRNGGMVARLGKAETDEELRKRMTGRPDLQWVHEHDVKQAFLDAQRATGEESGTGSRKGEDGTQGTAGISPDIAPVWLEKGSRL